MFRPMQLQNVILPAHAGIEAYARDKIYICAGNRRPPVVRTSQQRGGEPCSDGPRTGRGRGSRIQLCEYERRGCRYGGDGEDAAGRSEDAWTPGSELPPAATATEGLAGTGNAEGFSK